LVFACRAACRVFDARAVAAVWLALVFAETLAGDLRVAALRVEPVGRVAWPSPGSSCSGAPVAVELRCACAISHGHKMRSPMVVIIAARMAAIVSALLLNLAHSPLRAWP
jgi:hypothetical protein